MKNRINMILIFGCVWLLAGCGKKEEMILAEMAGGTGDSAIMATTEQATEFAAGTDSTIAPELAAVHVCGAVVSPGVYELPKGSRVWDALEAAGGFLESASTDYLNLAEVIADGQKIYVPTCEEATMRMDMEEEEESGKVNINRASKELLMTLPGIGETKAESILAYRNEHGSFSSIEEIMEIPGIKEAVFSKIKDYITVN